MLGHYTRFNTFAFALPDERLRAYGRKSLPPSSSAPSRPQKRRWFPRDLEAYDPTSDLAKWKKDVLSAFETDMQQHVKEVKIAANEHGLFLATDALRELWHLDALAYFQVGGFSRKETYDEFKGYSQSAVYEGYTSLASLIELPLRLDKSKRAKQWSRVSHRRFERE